MVSLLAVQVLRPAPRRARRRPGAPRDAAPRQAGAVHRRRARALRARHPALRAAGRGHRGGRLHRLLRQPTTSPQSSGASRRDRLVSAFGELAAHEDALLDAAAGRSGPAQPRVRVHGTPARRTPTLLLQVEGVEPRAVYEHLVGHGVIAPAGSFYAIEASRHAGLGDTGGVRVGLSPYYDHRRPRPADRRTRSPRCRWVEPAQVRRDRPHWVHDLRAHRRDLADRHGRRPGARGRADPRRHRLRRRAQGLGEVVPRAHQQLDLHPARPPGAAAGQRDRRARGVDLDLGPRHRAVPRRPAPPRHRLRRGRGRADDRPARRRLRDDRPRPGLRRARRDPHVLLRGHHPGDPAHRRRRPLHRHQPRPERAEPAGQAAGDRRRGRADHHRDGAPALLRRQAQPADDAQRPQPPQRPLRDDGDGRRPDGHRHRQWARGRAAHHPGADRLDESRAGRALPLPARPRSSTPSPTWSRASVLDARRIGPLVSAVAAPASARSRRPGRSRSG